LQERVLEAAFDQNGDRLFVLVRGHDALQDTFGHGSVLLLRSFNGFLVQNRLDARYVLADGVHAGGILKLAGGLTEAEVERFFLEREQLGVLALSSCAFMRVFLFSITRAPLPVCRVTLNPVDQ
jgi:hypothetical protein